MKAIINKEIYLPDKIIENGYVVISDEKIIDTGEMKDFDYDCEILELDGTKVVPGFIDIHSHGGYGSDFMEGTNEALANITASIPNEGTTSILATTLTSSEGELKNALQGISNYIKTNNSPGKAQIIGIHLEGPFINPEKCGAQPLEYIIEPSVNEFKKYQVAADNQIKVVTYAVEKDENLEFTKYLKSQNICPSLGHTLADYEQICTGIEFGMSGVTHTFNAMPKGYNDVSETTGATLMSDELYNEMITDGIHVNKDDVKKFIDRKKDGRMIVITDSMQAKGQADGEYHLGGQKVIKKNGSARLTSNNALAGSVAKMIDNILNVRDFTGLSLKECIDMATINPANYLGLHNKGRIAINCDADLVVLSEDDRIVVTICRGEISENNSKR